MRLMNREYDQRTGVTTEYYAEPIGNGETKITIRKLADVQANLDAVKELRAGTGHFEKVGDLQHIASIPNIFVDEWKNEHGFDYFKASNQERMLFMKSRPEYQAFRTHDKIGC